MTSRPGFVTPRVWTDEQLGADRRRSIENFIAEWSARGTEQYRRVLTENIRLAADLLEATDDLLRFSSGQALADVPSRTNIARYLSGPPISSDDLDTLADQSVAKRKRLPRDLAQKAASLIAAAIDRDRFQWLFDDPPRRPTVEERQAAIRWTAGLRAVQNVQTSNRSESSKRQEKAVEDVLLSLGFAKVGSRPISIISELDTSTFCRETTVVGTKCDLPVRLADGRLLLIECKVSNSSTNSVKRLSRECGNKAGEWRRQFGEQAITAAVLAGVFKLNNLRDAQHNNRIAIFWEHNGTCQPC